MSTARPVLAALAGALVLPLAACSALPGAGPDLPDLATIEPAWSVEGTDTWIGGTWDEPALWATDDLLVSVGGPIRGDEIDVVAVDRRDGTSVWTAQLAGATCAISSDLTDDGLGAILYRPSPDADCVGVAVVDTAAGEVVWERALGLGGEGGAPTGRQAIVPGIGIGETSVNVTSGCGRVARLAPADGAVVETLGSVGGCEGTGGIRGSLVAYDEGRGDAARSVLLDTDTGEELWRVPARGTTAGIVSTDPLVVDRLDADGRMLRRLGPGGDQAAVIGLRLGGSLPVFSPLAVTGDVVVGTYGDERVVAHDTATGEILWDRPYDRYSPERRLVGARGDELIWVQTFRDPDRPGQDETWVSASDPRDPDAGRMIGALQEEYRVGIDELWFVYGDQLVSAGADLAAYPLDGADDAAEPVALTEVPPGYEYDLDADVPWTDDDVRPDDVAGSCRDVSAATLEDLGLRTDLPPPADCRWSETTDRGAVRLLVDVTAAEPSSGTTAEEAAAQAVATSVAAADPRVREVPLGDEAVAVASSGATRASAADPAPSTEVSADLTVRRGNVVVTVDLAAGGAEADLARGLTPQELQAAAAAVVADVLGGPDAEPPPPGQDGPVTTAPADACAPSAPLPRLVPDGVARTLPAGDRRTACVVEPRDAAFPESSLTVVAEAVRPDPLGGGSAVEVAGGQLDDAREQAVVDLAVVEEPDGPGDEALLLSSERFYRTTTLVVRSDNLVITLRHQGAGDEPPGATVRDLSALAQRLVRG